MGKHIPGNPTIVVQNAPGAGSMRAANMLYNVAPKDGTAFGMFGRGIALEPLIGTSPAQFEATKFLWLGSGTEEAAVVVIRARRRIKTWADMLSKPFTVGGEGTGSDPDVYALMLKNVFGVKLRLISGYPGTTEMALARRARRGRRPRELVVDQPEVAEAGLAREEEGRHSGAAQHALQRRPQGRAADRRLRQDRAAAADHESRHQPAGHGPAVHGAARPARRPRGGAADGIRRRP